MADAESLGLTAVARKIFGASIIKSLQERKITPRDIWELTSPTIQCARTVGPVTPETLCWICGTRITQELGMAPQCEHILPIAQAATYLKLYNTEMKEAAVGDKWLMGEYGWAHTVCNQEKSDTCPLVVDRARSRFDIDKRQITQLLKDIFSSKRKDSEIIRRKLRGRYDTQEKFIKERTKPISDKYQNIIEIITKAPGGDPARINAANLITLAGLTGLSDISVIKPSLRELLNPEAVAAASSKVDELIAEKANWLFTPNNLLELANFFDVYDKIQARVRALVSTGEVNLTLSMQPKYREYFAGIGLNPADPLNSMNADNFQGSIFEFIVHAYPEIYIKLHRGADRERDTKKDVIEIFSTYILYKLLSEMNISFDDPRAPRGFKEQFQAGSAYLLGKLGQGSLEFIERTYKTYEMKELRGAAEVMAGLRDAPMNLDQEITEAELVRLYREHNERAASIAAATERRLESMGPEGVAASALGILRGPKISPTRVPVPAPPSPMALPVKAKKGVKKTATKRFSVKGLSASASVKRTAKRSAKRSAYAKRTASAKGSTRKTLKGRKSTLQKVSGE